MLSLSGTINTYNHFSFAGNKKQQYCNYKDSFKKTDAKISFKGQQPENSSVTLPIDELEKVFSKADRIIRNAKTIENKYKIIHIVCEKFKNIGKKWAQVHEESLPNIKKQELCHDLPHEVNNMLQLILSTADMSTHFDEPLPHDFDDTCSKIFKNAATLYKLYQLDNEKSNLAKKFKSILKMHENYAQLKNVKISVSKERLLKNVEPPSGVFGGNILMVFSTILGNAVKYNKDGGKVKIKFSLAKPPKDNERLKGCSLLNYIVTDNGRGIPEGEIPLVLSGERGSNTAGVEGTGYGLARANNILNRAYSEIKVESPVGKKQGTRVICPIPMKICRGESGIMKFLKSALRK